MLSPTRPPTTDSASTTSSTVAVVRVTRSTRPTSPSSLTTVRSGRSPASEPASMVTVREKVWDGADRRRRGPGTSAWPSVLAAAVRPSYSAEAVAVEAGGVDLLAQVGVLAGQGGDLVGAASRGCGTSSGIGGERGARRRRRPTSAGPNTSPTARRAGSSGESAPPW